MMSDVLVEINKGFNGLLCSSRNVYSDGALTLGFGDLKVETRFGKIREAFTIGTYNAGWRFVKDGELYLGSNELAESIDAKQHMLDSIVLGGVSAIKLRSTFDLDVVFENGVVLTFFCLSTDDDEILHFFCGKGCVFSYSYRAGWSD